MAYRIGLALAALLAFVGLPAALTAATLTVDAQSNIFGAGRAVPPAPGGGAAGMLPPSHAFVAGAGRTLIFSSVSGLVSCCADLSSLACGPDGGPWASGTTDILSCGGIAGVVHDHRTMFLVGVFTDGTVPADPAPIRLDFGAGGITDAFTTLAPELNQVFFIGDGLTGTGAGPAQRFSVPPSASFLYLGFADATQFGDPTGMPGDYGDNMGSLEATFDIDDPTPALAVTWGVLKVLYR